MIKVNDQIEGCGWTVLLFRSKNQNIWKKTEQGNCAWSMACEIGTTC